MSIAENIKYLRKKRGMTQKQLADQSGLAVITIQQYEAGKYIPKNDSVLKLRKALDCNIHEITDMPIDLIIDPDDIPFQSLDDDSLSLLTKDEHEYQILINYRKLNSEGKKEVSKRIQELTEIPRYVEESIDYATQTIAKSVQDGHIQIRKKNEE